SCNHHSALQECHDAIAILHADLEVGTGRGYRAIADVHDEWPCRVVMYLEIGLPVLEGQVSLALADLHEQLAVRVQNHLGTIRQNNSALFSQRGGVTNPR